MHELALMQALACQAAEVARREGAVGVRRIHLRLGSLAGVDPDALRFAAEVVLGDGLTAGAQLEITMVPALAWCAACAALVPLEQGVGRCPGCGGPGGALRQGRELELAALELQMNDDDAAPARDPRQQP